MQSLNNCTIQLMYFIICELHEIPEQLDLNFVGEHRDTLIEQ